MKNGMTRGLGGYLKTNVGGSLKDLKCLIQEGVKEYYESVENGAVKLGKQGKKQLRVFGRKIDRKISNAPYTASLVAAGTGFVLGGLLLGWMMRRK